MTSNTKMRNPAVLEKLQRLIDQQWVVAGLVGGKQIDAEAIFAQACILAKPEDVSASEKEAALRLLGRTQRRHVAVAIFAKHAAQERAYFLGLVAEALHGESKQSRSQAVAPTKQNVALNKRTWQRIQVKMLKKFGARAPEDWNYLPDIWAEHQN